MNGFKLYSCKRTTFCKQVECYQCDEAFPNTQPEGTENNTAEWLLSKLLFTLRAGEWFSFAIASILRSKCGTCVINVTRFANIHNLKEQEITQMYSFYRNACSHLEQVKGFHLYSCKHTTFCMRDKCYQFTMTIFHQIHDLKELETSTAWTLHNKLSEYLYIQCTGKL